RLTPLRVLLGAAALELRVVDEEVDPTTGDVELDDVTVLHEADGPAGGRLRGHVTDGQARGPAGETAVGDQRAPRAEPGALEVGGRVEHLLHARSPLRPLVPDDDDVALLDLLREDHLDGVLLRLGDLRRSGEVPLVLGHARGLDDAPVRGEVAGEDGEAALGG